MNYKMLGNILGWILLFEGIFLALPALTAIVCGEGEMVWVFLITLGSCLTMGILLTLRRPKSTALYAKEGLVVVSLSWITLSLFGALPFFLSGYIPSFLDALFETVSGFTTTGASILSDVEALPKSLLLWRSFTNWIGGMGVLVFIMAFLPLSGGRNMHIMKAESTGPSVSKLVPRVRTTALILYCLYFILTLLQFILLLTVGGMDAFEALTTAFSTAGTGGFSIHNDGSFSISAASQIIMTVFMLIFSVNFATYYLVCTKRFREAFNTELRVFLCIVFASIILITLHLLNDGTYFATPGEAFRHVAFTVASIISTSGFATVDFAGWTTFAQTTLVLLMFVGGCAGSTAGGIKVSRFVIVFKGITNEIRGTIHPRQVRKVSIDKRPLEPEMVRSVNAYFVSFFLLFVISFLVLSFDALDVTSAFTATAATLNNIGPGLGAVGPTQNFGFLSVPSKIMCIVNMLAGRLELFPVLVLFHHATWRR